MALGAPGWGPSGNTPIDNLSSGFDFEQVTHGIECSEIESPHHQTGHGGISGKYDKQTGAKADDRSLSLLLTAQLENDLDRAIDFWIGEDQSASLRKDLYDRDGPLGNFSRKIILASVIRLLGPVSQENMRLIRHVRNAFAHAKAPITFQTPEVVAVCGDLVRINIFDPPQEVDQSADMSARERFATVCHETMIRLVRYTGHDVHFTNDGGTEMATISEVLP